MNPKKFFIEVINKKASPQFQDSILISILFFFLYGLTRDRVYFFDSVLFSLFISNPLSALPFENIFQWNHPLWVPICRLFYVLNSFFNKSITPYQSIQLQNAVTGAVLLGFIYLYFSRNYSRSRSALLTSLIGGSQLFWVRATSGEPYLLGALFLFTFSWSLIVFSERQQARFIFLIGVSLILACSCHIVNLIAWPIGIGGVFWLSKENRIRNILFLAFLLSFFIFPYAYFHGWFDPGGFHRWWEWGSSTVNGYNPSLSRSGLFSLNLSKNFLFALSSLIKSYIFIGDSQSAYIFLFLMLFLLIYFKVLRLIQWHLPSPIFLAIFIVYFMVFSFWVPGNTYYWATHIIFLTLFLSTCTKKGLSSEARAVEVIGIVFLMGINFWLKILPNMKGEDVRPSIQRCELISSNTLEGSEIIISGFLDSQEKVFIPYFAGRSPIALDLFATRVYRDHEHQLENFSKLVNKLVEKGIPIYMRGNVFESRSELDLWKIKDFVFSNILSRFDLIEVYRFSQQKNDSLLLLLPEKFPTEEKHAFCLAFEKSNLKEQTRDFCEKYK